MSRLASPVMCLLFWSSLPWPNQPSKIRLVTLSLPKNQFLETRTHNPDPEPADPDPSIQCPNRAQDLNLVRSRTSLKLVGSS